MVQAVTNPLCIINNILINYIPNTLTFNEGLGEQSVKTQTSGAGKVETVYYQNLENNVGMVKLSMRTTEENMRSAKFWKNNGNNNSIILAFENFTRTFLNCALTSSYEITFGDDGKFDIEFSGNSAI